jgi:hypothetical protein
MDSLACQRFFTMLICYELLCIMHYENVYCTLIMIAAREPVWTLETTS